MNSICVQVISLVVQRLSFKLETESYKMHVFCLDVVYGVILGQGFMLVYSVTDVRSFEFVPKLYQQVLRVKDVTEYPVLLVANKIDLVNQVASSSAVYLDQIYPFYMLHHQYCLFLDRCVFPELNSVFVALCHRTNGT